MIVYAQKVFLMFKYKRSETVSWAKMKHIEWLEVHRQEYKYV